MIDCTRCNGSGEFIPLDPPDPELLARTQEYLRAEEFAITGIEPVVNDTPAPRPPCCVVCHGSGTVPDGGLL